MPSVVDRMLGGPDGARYTTTYGGDVWLMAHGIDITPYAPVVERALDDKVWDFA